MIRTERLLLRMPTPADVEDPPPFLTDPRVMEFLGGVEDPREVVQQWLDGWEIYAAGKLVLETPAGERIGRVGFNFYEPAGWTRSDSPAALPELTWALAYEQWGKGYATESAVAARDWLGRADQISLIAPGNVRSQRVAERLGARPAETVELPDGGPHVVWRHRG